MIKRIIEVRLPPPQDPDQRSWARLVTGVDPAAAGARVFESEPLKRGRVAPLDPGAVVLLYDARPGGEHQVSLQVVDPARGLVEHASATGEGWPGALRGPVEHLLERAVVDEDPLLAASEWLDELARRVASREDRLRTDHPDLGEQLLDRFTRVRVLCASLGRDLRQGARGTRGPGRRRPALPPEPVVVTQGFDQRPDDEQPDNTPLPEPRW